MFEGQSSAQWHPQNYLLLGMRTTSQIPSPLTYLDDLKPLKHLNPQHIQSSKIYTVYQTSGQYVTISPLNNIFSLLLLLLFPLSISYCHS